MAKSKRKKSEIDLRPLVKEFGLKKYCEAIKIEDAIKYYGVKTIVRILVKDLGIDGIVACWSKKQREQAKELIRKREGN